MTFQKRQNELKNFLFQSMFQTKPYRREVTYGRKKKKKVGTMKLWRFIKSYEWVNIGEGLEGDRVFGG